MYPKMIYLIGPMGAGKSTIGRMLAQKMGLSFLDIDREIEERSGVSIAWIFDKEGEEGFRQRETAVIKELSEQSEKYVIATGGGSILRLENQKIMAATGFVVFLETSVDTQVERTSKDKRRPLLQNGADRRKVLEEIYQKRLPIYQSLSDLTVNTDAGTQYLVIQQIIDSINK